MIGANRIRPWVPHPSGLGLVGRTMTAEAWRRARQHRKARGSDALGDEGLTLVELLVAFTALIVLLTIVGTALTTYLTAGNTVLSSYSAVDNLLPSSIVIQRLIRSEVEPAPTPTVAGQVSSPMCPTLNAPCPAFVLGSGSPVSSAYSTTFYANVGAIKGNNYGPAKIVMSSSAPAPSGCTVATCTSQFTVTQQAPDANSCPFTITSTNHCTYTTAPVMTLASVNNVINGQTGLKYASTPIFAYNTLDPYSATYVAGAPTAGFVTGSCLAPTITTVNGIPTTTASNCPADNIQSIAVDLNVRVNATAFQENYFVVFRLSSFSYLYSPIVG